MISRRAFTVAVASLFTIGPAAAQDWPTRPVTMVVPFPPGGGTDVLGRIIGHRLSEILGQQVIIDNVGGAGGISARTRSPGRRPTAMSSCSAAAPMPSIRRSTSIRFTI
jgi:tripartite-type tricarboxylate transporter receptor subunit TctC